MMADIASKTHGSVPLLCLGPNHPGLGTALFLCDKLDNSWPPLLNRTVGGSIFLPCSPTLVVSAQLDFMPYKIKGLLLFSYNKQLNSPNAVTKTKIQTLS